MASIPLVRVLTDAGYGSRRQSSMLVKRGLVVVNGRIASSFTERVDPQVDSIVVMGKKQAGGVTRRVYLMMHKPEGYLSTTVDDRGRPTVMDLLPENLRTSGLHPAGRLDEDSTGLLILTNDGQLTYELTHPRYEHEKEYYVATTGRLTDADLDKLEQGVEIDGRMTWPAKLRLLLGQSPYTYSITIHEGRKRQIRQMFAAIGQHAARLKRVRIGGLVLGTLEEGAWRELTPAELRQLMRKRPEEQRSPRAGGSTGGGRGSRQDDRYSSASRRAPARDAHPTRRPLTTRTQSVRSRAGTRPEYRSQEHPSPTGFRPASGQRREPPLRREQQRSRSHANPYRSSSTGRDPQRDTRREPRTAREQGRPRRTTGERRPRPFARRGLDAGAKRREPRTY